MRNSEFSQAIMSMFGEASRVMYELRVGVKPSNITQTQYNIMEYIFFHEGGVTVSSISGCLYMSMPNASREVKKLIELDCLAKVQSQKDKRTHQVVLTPAGQELMTHAFSEVFRRSNQRYAHLSEEEIDVLIKQLKAITDKLFF